MVRSHAPRRSSQQGIETEDVLIILFPVAKILESGAEK
jgi:hypothetical protein